MKEKITHKQHKSMLTFLFCLSLIIGIGFSRMIVGKYPNYDVLLTLMFGIIMAIGVLVVVILGILVRMEEDFYWHQKKL